MRKQIGLWVMGLVIATSTLAQNAAPSLRLDEYQLVSGPTPIEGVAENASGVIYDKGRDALWIVQNNPTIMTELDRATLKPRRTVVLAGFEDTEDLVQLSSNKFAVLEERKRNLVLFSITNQATSISRLNVSAFNIDPIPADNLGLEGLTFDGHHFLIVKEKDPAVIYQVTVAKNKEPEISHPWDLGVSNFGLTDFSAIHFHTGTGHLVILSDESKAVVEVTMTGEEISRLSLDSGSNGILEKPPQPEGVTLDDKDRLYVCSEPNLLYVFEKSGTASPSSVEDPDAP